MLFESFSLLSKCSDIIYVIEDYFSLAKMGIGGRRKMQNFKTYFSSSVAQGGERKSVFLS